MPTPEEIQGRIEDAPQRMTLPEPIEYKIRTIMNRIYSAAGIARMGHIGLYHAAVSHDADVVAARGLLEELETLLGNISEQLDPVNLNSAEEVAS